MSNKRHHDQIFFARPFGNQMKKSNTDSPQGADYLSGKNITIKIARETDIVSISCQDGEKVDVCVYLS
jgi:hypothetical protein